MLSNHDNVRHRSRYGSEARARAALFLLLGLRGSPVLYAGEELGLEDIARERRRGFPRQWLANVNRVRDVVAVTTALHSTISDLRRQSG